MNEKLRILKMIEEGKITAEEGARLMEAVEDKKEEIITKGKEGSPKWLRVRVFEPGKKSKVNVNVPITLVETGMKLGMAFDKNMQEKMGDVDINEILQAIKDGAEGKIVEVDSDDGEKVEIYIE